MRRGIALAGVVAVAVGALVVPLPWFELSPGDALPAEDRVRVERPGGADVVFGDLLLLTVSLSRPTAVEALRAWVDDTRDLLPRSDVVPKGVDVAEYLSAQRRVFREAGTVAAAVGLRAAGVEVPATGTGAGIVRVQSGGPAAGRLLVGDVIVAVDDRPVAVASDLGPALAGHALGDVVVLAVRRAGRERRVRVALGRVPGRDTPGLGVAVETAGLDITLPFEVRVEQGNIGGPSAGLMIALAVYDEADPGDLAAGRTIAGTGTIDLDGRVGPVGGVHQKVEAAVSAGATLLLAPVEEVADARRAARGRLKVVGVGTMTEALEALAGTDR